MSHHAQPDFEPRDEAGISTKRIESVAEDAAKSALELAMPKLLKEINEKLALILDRLAKGDTELALLRHRVDFLEKIVYGGCTLLGTTVVIALLSLVVHH